MHRPAVSQGGAEGQGSGAPGEDRAERRHEPRLRVDEEGERPERGQPAEPAAFRQDHHGRHEGGEQGGLHPQQGKAHQLGVAGRGQHGEGGDPGGTLEDDAAAAVSASVAASRATLATFDASGGPSTAASGARRRSQPVLVTPSTRGRRIEHEAVAGEEVRDVMETYIGIIHEQAAVAPGGREEPGGRERGDQPARPRFSRTRGFLTFQMMPSTM